MKQYGLYLRQPLSSTFQVLGVLVLFESSLLVQFKSKSNMN